MTLRNAIAYFFLFGVMINLIYAIGFFLDVDIASSIFNQDGQLKNSVLFLTDDNFDLAGVVHLGSAFVGYIIYRLIHTDIQTIPPYVQRRF